MLGRIAASLGAVVGLLWVLSRLALYMTLREPYAGAECVPVADQTAFAPWATLHGARPARFSSGACKGTQLPVVRCSFGERSMLEVQCLGGAGRQTQAWVRFDARNRTAQPVQLHAEGDKHAGYVRVGPGVQQAWVACGPAPGVNERLCVFNQPRRPGSKRRAAEPHDKPNVVIIMLDELSRAQARTQLQAVMALHRRVSGTYAVFDFELFRAVGECSTMNQGPLFAGCQPPEPRDKEHAIDRLHHRHDVSHREVYCRHSQLKHPSKNTWIWPLFRDQGYVTMWGEELCSAASKFSLAAHFGKRGAPVDFVTPDFYCHVDQNSVLDEYCYLGRHPHEYTLDYALQFFENHPQPRFLSVDLIASHENPAISRVSAADADLAQFVQQIASRLDGANTIIMIMSDHGYKPRSTRAFAKEHVRPLLLVFVPHALAANEKWLDRIDLDVIKTNTKRLVTAYDLYATLLGLLETNHSKIRPKWAYSLFDQEVPEDRSCLDARIPPRYCPCVRAQEVAAKHPRAYAALDHLPWWGW